jgi:hypothetical protein
MTTTSDVPTHDRGLGTAYERYCFYQRLDAWKDEYGIETMLEGPIDRMAGVRGVHGVGLALRGVRVVSALETEEEAGLARGVYNGCGAKGVEVRVAPRERLAELPKSDLVLAYHALPEVQDWRAYLATLASLTKKILVVAVCNPDNWGVAAIRTAARLRGVRGLEPPETWRTEVLAPALWNIGRVRDHVYFDCPWWPDLQVAPGQSLVDRAKGFFRRKKGDVRFTETFGDVELAAKFVYGPGRWPYFGGPGWGDELMPALLRHPGFDGSPTRLLPRLAHLHAFVVDLRPRTPQARRRLAQVP